MSDDVPDLKLVLDGSALGDLVAERDRMLDERDELRERVAAAADMLDAHKEVVNALGDAFAGSLTDGVRRIRAERDRLRAVVDAAKDYRLAWDAAPTQPMTDAEDATMERLLDALDALDRSDVMGGSGAEGEHG